MSAVFSAIRVYVLRAPSGRHTSKAISRNLKEQQ